MTYNKTNWVPNETIVSADNLNKVENQLELLTTKTQVVEESIEETSQSLTSHKSEDASLTTKGHVQLNSATNSEDETTAATPKAVKLAIDQADSVNVALTTHKNDFETHVDNSSKHLENGMLSITNSTDSKKYLLKMDKDGLYLEEV